MNMSTLLTPGWLRPPSLALCAEECGARCCRQRRLVILSASEGARLKAKREDVLIAQGTDGRLAMLLNPICVFLHPETNRCTIHAERPDACRAFPQRPSVGCRVWPKDD